jgi:hypothetical protein
MTALAVAIGFATFALKLWALVDVFRHPDSAYREADRMTRRIWIAVLVAALALHLWVGGLAWGGIAGTVVALIYLVDVRPRVTRAEDAAA